MVRKGAWLGRWAGLPGGRAGLRSGRAGLPGGRAGLRSGRAGLPSGRAGLPSARAGLLGARAGGPGRRVPRAGHPSRLTMKRAVWVKKMRSSLYRSGSRFRSSSEANMISSQRSAAAWSMANGMCRMRRRGWPRWSL